MLVAAPRRTGWALRRYRGAHRIGAWTVAGLAEAIAVQDTGRARAHRRHLRRPYENPGPVYLGTMLQNVKFYGVPAGPDEITPTDTLTFIDEEPVLTLSNLLLGPPGAGDDYPPLEYPARTWFPGDTDTPTGPVLLYDISDGNPT